MSECVLENRGKFLIFNHVGIEFVKH